MDPQSVVAQLVTIIVEYGGTIASKLAPIGLGLTGAFLLIKLAWEGLQMTMGMRSANEGIANILFTLCIGSVLATMFLPDVGLYKSIISTITGGFDYISATLTNSSAGTSQLTNLTQPLFDIITSIAKLLVELLSSMNIGWTDIPGSIVQSITALITAFYLILVLFLFVITFAVAVIFFLMATVTFSIGVAFGPVLIPLILFKPLEEAPNRWFWFVMSAGMSKIMILVLLLFGSKATTHAFGIISKELLNLITDKNAFSLSNLIMPSLSLTICALLILVLMLKAEAITNALLPGHGAMGLGGFMRAAASVGKGPGAFAKGSGSAAKGVGAAAAGTGNAIGRATGATLRTMGNVSKTATRTGESNGVTALKMAGQGIKGKMAGVGAAASAKGNAWLGNSPKGNSPSGGAASSAFRDKMAAVRANTQSKR